MRKKMLLPKIKKAMLNLAVFATFISTSIAQVTTWVKPFKPGSSSNHVTVADVETDASGNVYTVGSFKGTVDFNFGGTATNLTSLGGYDVFITKHNSAGVLLWAKSVGNTADDVASSVGLGNNAVIVGGSFKSTNMDFDPGAGVVPLSSVGGSDLFVLTLNASGIYTWAKRAGGQFDEVVSDVEIVTISSTDYIYLGGTFASGLMDFFSNTNTLSHGGSDAFICGLTSAGAYMSVKVIGGAGNDVGHKITRVAYSLIMCSDILAASTTFDPGNGTLSGTFAGQVSNGIVSSFDLTFAGLPFEGFHQFKGNTSVVASMYAGYSVGRLRVVGTFQSSMDIDPSATVLSIAAVGARDMFIVDVNLPNGTSTYFSHILGKGISATSSVNVVDVFRNVSANSNDFYIWGYVIGAADIGGTTAADISGPGTSTNAFFAKYANAINGPSVTLAYAYENALAYISAESSVTNCLTESSTGNIILGGTYASTSSTPLPATFNPGGLIGSFGAPTFGIATMGYLQYVTNCTTPTLTVTPGSRCGTGTVALSATPSAGSVSWYTALTGGVAIATGNSYTTPSISSTTTYYVAANNAGCISTPRTAVTATVTALPTITATVPGSRCGTGTVSLSATPSAGTVSWFAALTGGVALATSNSFTTPSISASTTYYASATNGTCTSASRTAVTATITATPTITSTIPATRCGVGTLTLSATPSAGTISWFASLTGGVALATGNSFTTPSIGASTTYYASATNGACSSTPRTAVVASVTSSVTPAVSIAATQTNICAGTSVTFTATPTNGGSTPAYQWKVNGTNVGTNTATYSSTTLTNAASVTCVMTSNSACASPLSATSNTVAITVSSTVAPAVSIAATQTSICAGTSVTFTATPTNGGTTPAYQWKVNGTNVGTNTATYSSTTLTNAASVTCVMTSNSACASPLSATSNAVAITVSSTVAPAVSIAATQTSICAGTSVTFTATPTNGGTSPAYQWKVNGTNVGTNTATYSSTTLTNAASVTCVMTSNSACASPLSATSNSVAITVSSTVTPSVSIVATQISICAGTSVTFTATPTNGGTTPSYQWKVNGTNVGTNTATYSSTTLTNAASVTCVMTSNAACASPLSATSNALAITVSSTVTPSVSIVATQISICAGTSVTFTATPTNGGTTPIFQWKRNGLAVGSNSSTYTSTTLTNGMNVTCDLTSNAACVSQVSATSNSIIMNVSTPVTPSISIIASQTSICTGTNISFTATTLNGGTNPTYQWKLNGVTVGTNNSVYSSNTLANNDVIVCLLTSNEACLSTASATSNSITMTTTSAVPSVTISASQPTLCSGNPAQFIANPVNGGTAPTYVWKVNGTAAGSGDQFISSSLVNGDVIICELTSNATCANPSTATSAPLTVNIVQTVVPAITIAASQTTICAGVQVIFTANETNGGALPSFQWKLNGNNIGLDAASFSATNLSNNSVITCELSSSATCASGIAVSNSITVNVNPLPNTTVSQTSQTLSVVQSSASYQWLDCSNGSAVNGAINQSFLPLASSSYAVIVNLAGCIDTSLCFNFILNGINPNEIINLLSLYPNPTNNLVTLEIPKSQIGEAYVLVNKVGQTVLYGTFSDSFQTLELKNMAPGIYYLQLKTTQKILGKIVKM